ncbi:SurA N-terminal domain-containing protein [Amphibacillus marinus]|uniref:peptidylprolyl isomerase n=1 Tax=Amphibacillus marinus TaxID=872970 RepID=A0A1H8QWH9_9BACI|nr:SurA N-terminal domain-containing protein [Amphibacillus marinus]SEO58670.1 SurA N-terminal domain-containing protein [Amphibacillus marinus]
MAKSYLRILLLISSILFFLIACTSDQEEAEQTINQIKPNLELDGDPEVDLEALISAEEQLDSDQVVLTVNGEYVYGEAYNAVYQDIKLAMFENGDDIETLSVIHDETVDMLARRLVLMQDAEARGITVSNEELDDVFFETKAQFDSEEDFNNVLAQLAFTEESFRETIQVQLIQQLYIEQEFTHLTVTEYEVEEFYAILENQMDEAPPLAELATEIENQILQSKIQAALEERVETLMEVAEIEE